MDGRNIFTVKTQTPLYKRKIIFDLHKLTWVWVPSLFYQRRTKWFHCYGYIHSMEENKNTCSVIIIYTWIEAMLFSYVRSASHIIRWELRLVTNSTQFDFWFKSLIKTHASYYVKYIGNFILVSFEKWIGIWG